MPSAFLQQLKDLRILDDERIDVHLQNFWDEDLKERSPEEIAEQLGSVEIAGDIQRLARTLKAILDGGELTQAHRQVLARAPLVLQAIIDNAGDGSDLRDVINPATKFGKVVDDLGKSAGATAGNEQVRGQVVGAMGGLRQMHKNLTKAKGLVADYCREQGIVTVPEPGKGA